MIDTESMNARKRSTGPVTYYPLFHPAMVDKRAIEELKKDFLRKFESDKRSVDSKEKR